MVKILQAYNFARQNTFSLNGELLAATLIDSHRIAICSAEQFIEIYDIEGRQRQLGECATATAADQENANAAPPLLIGNAASGSGDERAPLKYSLATVGEVVNLIYCDAGKYLLTLEKENVGSPVHSNSTSISCTSSSNTSATVYSEEDTKMFVRVYANFWKFAEAKLIDLPITIRIASMTTPKAPLVESIDVIELALRSPPDLIQCCQTSGNIIVGSKDRIYLYEFTQCTHESTQPRFSYIDFLPFKFFVSLNFVPLKLCLAENVIACMNNRYCVAFKVVDTLSAGAPVGEGALIVHGLDGLRGYERDDEATGGNAADDVVSTTTTSTAAESSASIRNSCYETDSLETSSSGVVPFAGQAGFPGRTPVDFNVARIVNAACGRELEVDLRSQWDQRDPGNGSGVDTQEIIITPSRASDIKIKLVNEAKAMNVQRISSHSNVAAAYQDETAVQYDVRKLLQICMKTSEPSERIVDILRCMDLRAIYQRDDAAEGSTAAMADSEYDMGNQQVPGAVSSTKHANRRTLKSNRHPNCIGYALLAASSVDGYLYQFCAQGKWYSENEKPVATYSFTAPVLKVHIGDYVVYAITAESVETHTSRIGHKLFHNRFEYPTISGLFPEESSPDVNAAIAVIGLSAFVHVQYACVSRDSLVLISSSAHADLKRRSGGAVVEVKRNIAARLLAEAKAKHSLLRSGSSAAQQQAVNEWTLYSLEVPPVESVIEDLEGIAETYRTASTSNFYDLMEEAHIMLRLSLSLQLGELGGLREQRLRAKFMANCRKLADFSIRSKRREIYMQATGFYKMCNLQLTDIYVNYVGNVTLSGARPESPDNGPIKAHNAEQLVGLVYTVKLFLLSLGADRQRAAFLNQLVKPFFTPRRVIEQGCVLVPLSLELLNLFVKYAPADVAPIMLHSPVLADVISGELINYLKYLDVLNPEENLLLAVTACRMSNYLLSQEVVAKTSRRSLAVALIRHKNVLFDDGTILLHKQRVEASKATSSASHSHRQQHSSASQAAASARQRQQPRKSSLSGLQQQQQSADSPANNLVSFSEFTETILLASENADLVEAISDVFVHALCIERSISLDQVLQLFLNYIAAHIGHKGYQTAQKVFANVLQVFYYDYFDVSGTQPSSGGEPHSNTPPPHIDEEEDYDELSSSRAPSLISERDNESCANSVGDTTNSGPSSSVDEATSSGRRNRIVYDPLHEQHSPYRRNCGGNTAASPSQQQQQRHGDDAAHLDAADCEGHLKGLKILFRMYLGRHQALSDLLTDLQSADIEQQSTHEDFLSLRVECVRFMLRYLQEMRQQQQSLQPQRCLDSHTQRAAAKQYYYPKSNLGTNVRAAAAAERKLVFVPYIPDYKLIGPEFERHIKAYIRPIPCLLERPQYLNRLPPFKRSDFSYPDREEGECEVRFASWHNELLTLTLKIQSLLASPRIEREIVEEFIAFIQKTPDLVGIDSFLVIVLPKHLAINYMLNFCPEYLWHYGKSSGFTPKHWESLLRKILSKQELLPNWKTHITEILNNLVTELSFEELLQCFPSEVVVQNRSRAAFLKEFSEQRINRIADGKTHIFADHQQDDEEEAMKNGGIRREHLPMDNIEENNVFEVVLRKAVAKQRSIALRSMIESTGSQLFDATSNPMYNL